MKNGRFQKSNWILILIFTSTITLQMACSNSGSGDGDNGSDRVVGADIAYNEWPNETTSDKNSSEITSKVLMKDLDEDGGLENIFLTVLPNSSSKGTSIVRVTSGPNFSEVVNYKSNRISLLQDSIPFAYDFNKDGFHELVFVSFDRDQVYAFEFKNKLKKLFIRWTADLPEVLDVDFDRRIQKVLFQDEPLIKVGPFGLTEIKNKKVSVIDLRSKQN